MEFFVIGGKGLMHFWAVSIVISLISWTIFFIINSFTQNRYDPDKGKCLIDTSTFTTFKNSATYEYLLEGITIGDILLLILAIFAMGFNIAICLIFTFYFGGVLLGSISKAADIIIFKIDNSIKINLKKK